MKKFAVVLCLVLSLVMALSSCSAFFEGVEAGLAGTQKEEKFLELVSENQELLDDYADDIYRNWYDCIYNDKFNEDINTAIYSAMLDNSANISRIEANNEQIKELYKDAKDGELEDEVKAVMQAYNEYYAFVMEVSGSFKSYSASKESLKKALATALRNLEAEL